MLAPERVTQLKTALNAAMFQRGIVVPGFRVYRKNRLGQVVPVTIVGPYCREALRRYQRIEGLPVTGEFDTATQAHLIPAPTMKGGAKVAKAAYHGLSLRPRHYDQARPAPMSWAGFVRLGSDCSGFSILCFHDAGLPDPNDTNYSGYGNTWSLIAKGVHIPTAQLAPGDLVFYGNQPGNPTHVEVYVGDGYEIGHGHEGGPALNRLDYIDSSNFHRIDQRRYRGEA